MSETPYPLPEWVKKLKSNLFGNKKSVSSDIIQQKEPDVETKVVDVTGLMEDIRHHLTSDYALSLSMHETEGKTDGLMRFIIFDGEEGVRVGLFATTNFWLDPKVDRAVLGSTTFIDMIGINIFDKKTQTVAYINWNKFVNTIGSGVRDFSGDEYSRQTFEEDYQNPVSSQWESGIEPIGVSQYRLLVKTLANGKVNRDCMNGEVLKMKDIGGSVVEVENDAQISAINNLISEMMQNISPKLRII